ncbi:hypothetical protein V6R21_21095 [Limibacter armeniacum]|uniref:hypothetical protein n=1 Tax=Limibacter armeniacum TaxID=466084 RepID=UPI002FE5EE9E
MKKIDKWFLVFTTMMMLVAFMTSSCSESSDEYSGPTKDVHLTVKTDNIDKDSLYVTGQLLLQGKLRFAVIRLDNEPLSVLEAESAELAYDIYTPYWYGATNDGLEAIPSAVIVGGNTDSLAIIFKTVTSQLSD